MAEQENTVAASPGDGTTEAEGNSGSEVVSEVSPPDSLNEVPDASQVHDVLEPTQTTQTEPVEQSTSASPVDEHLVKNEIQVKEEVSVSEKDPRKEPDGQECISSSGEVQENKSEGPDKCSEEFAEVVTTDVGSAPVSSEFEPKAEQLIVESPMPVEVPETAVTNNAPQEAEQSASLETTATTEETVPPTPVDQETVTSKPQVVGETYQQTNGVDSALPAVQAPLVTVQPAALPTPRSERPPFNPGSDSKIAQEIQEMQEREEELRRMRERAQHQQQNGVKSSSGMSDSGGSVHSDEGRGPCGQASPVPPEDKPSGYVNGQLDSLQGQTVYNLGYALGHRRMESVKVKPLSDENEAKVQQESPSTFPVLKESPIEREIRLAHEREEELRKEKGLPLTGQQQRPNSLTLNGGGPWRGVVNGGVKTDGSATKDTQRFLATTRIQQEIVEQTEREMALRASGMIQTISQERTDAKVTRLRDVTSPGDKRALLLSSPPTSPALSSASDSDKSGPTAPIANGTVNGHHPKTPSPTSSLSGGQVVQGTSNGGSRRFANTPQVRGVSMQRFIASKGRELSFSTFGSKTQQKSSSAVNLHAEPIKCGPREGPRSLGSTGTAAPTTNGTPVKRCVSAETKIQDELKEMQAREDELKQQRARLLGLSQPNLTTLSGEEDLQDENELHMEGNKQEIMDRALSNPNLLDDEVQYDEDGKISVGGPRRRSMLIDQWEKRIKKKEDIKAT